MLSDHRGKVVLLNFFATWCGPCNMEAPELAKLYSEYTDRGLEVLAVCLDSDNKTALARFVSEHGVTYPVFAKSSEGEKAYAVAGIPFTVLIDAQGKEVERFLGYREPGEFKVRLDALLPARR